MTVVHLFGSSEHRHGGLRLWREDERASCAGDGCRKRICAGLERARAAATTPGSLRLTLAQASSALTEASAYQMEGVSRQRENGMRNPKSLAGCLTWMSVEVPEDRLSARAPQKPGSTASATDICTLDADRHINRLAHLDPWKSRHRQLIAPPSVLSQLGIHPGYSQRIYSSYPLCNLCERNVTWRAWQLATGFPCGGMCRKECAAWEEHSVVAG